MITSSSHTLDIKDLSLRFGRNQILTEVDFAISKDAGVVGLFGPNGAGKTSLIQCIARVINSYTGTIARTSTGSVAYLPDIPVLPRFFKLSDCIDLYSALFVDFDERTARALLDDLGLSLRRTVEECSKGMSEQVHIALLLARQTMLYVMDEPLAAVDPLTRDVLVEMINTRRYPGSSVLLSTHLISDVSSLFDEIVVLHGGRVVLAGQVEELKESEQDLEEVFKNAIRQITPAV